MTIVPTSAPTKIVTLLPIRSDKTLKALNSSLTPLDHLTKHSTLLQIRPDPMTIVPTSAPTQSATLPPMLLPIRLDPMTNVLRISAPTKLASSLPISSDPMAMVPNSDPMAMVPNSDPMAMVPNSDPMAMVPNSTLARTDHP